MSAPLNLEGAIKELSFFKLAAHLQICDHCRKIFGIIFGTIIFENHF
jgi:predicted anti-sigma-YlaC factor YlaD